MRTLWLMLMVLVVEYTFGASDINTALANNDGGNYMKIRIADFTILPNNLGKLDIEGINLTADDMLSTISSFDKLYDYKVYRAFNEQFIVVAYIKGESDTILDMQYMSLNNVKEWYQNKLDEKMNKEVI
jgi:hypothetical protein